MPSGVPAELPPEPVCAEASGGMPGVVPVPADAPGIASGIPPGLPAGEPAPGMLTAPPPGMAGAPPDSLVGVLALGQPVSRAQLASSGATAAMRQRGGLLDVVGINNVSCFHGLAVGKTRPEPGFAQLACQA